MAEERQEFLDRMYALRRAVYRDKCSGLSSDGEIFKDQVNKEQDDKCSHEK